jgi:hypothetical protein
MARFLIKTNLVPLTALNGGGVWFALSECAC